jgi:CBS domain-containing protein
MSGKTVSDLMHKGIIACRSETPLTEVVHIMVDTDVHAIVVIDDEGKAQGIISDADLVQFYGQEIGERTAGEAMSALLFEIDSDQPSQLAAKRMLEQGVYRLLVVEVEGKERRLVGTISAADLVREMRGARWFWHVG